MVAHFLAAGLAFLAFFFGAGAAAALAAIVRGGWMRRTRRTESKCHKHCGNNSSKRTRRGVPMRQSLAAALPAMARDCEE